MGKSKKSKYAKMEKKLRERKEENRDLKREMASTKHEMASTKREMASMKRNQLPTNGIGWHTASDGTVIIHDPDEKKVKQEPQEDTASEEETMTESEPSDEETMTESEPSNEETIAREATPEENLLETQPQPRKFRLTFAAGEQDQTEEPAQAHQILPPPSAPAVKKSRGPKPPVPVRGETDFVSPRRTRSDKVTPFQRFGTPRLNEPDVVAVPWR